MVRIPLARIEQLIAEDVPYVDLTTEVLGIGDCPGIMTYYTREDCVLAGTEVVMSMASDLGLSIGSYKPSGVCLAKDDDFFEVKGSAAQLHQLWKVGLNTFDHLSAVATKTRTMVDAVHAVNPHCEILTTRKSMPGAKDLLTLAVMAGGAYPHRLGLSETVLIFDNHLAFMGGIDGLIEKLPTIKSHCIEKKLFVETGVEDALRLAQFGAENPHARLDGIQFEKIPAEEMSGLVKKIRSIDPLLTLIAAGGINPTNAASYAATGIDGIATTAPFTAKPIDMSVRMEITAE
ncbi:MAG: ModD protein [Coriobacteriales bacterium]|nr:ModD protein [Coriobacteriales bacterium]